MSGIASAEQVEEWPFGQRNVMPDYVEGVMYDFEEGSNCGDFNNQNPEIATFLTVLGGNVPLGYGPSYPSYARVGGSMCGNTRCYMNIYPYSHLENYTHVVNGNSSFSPISCCECDTCWTGNCYPNMDARIQFKEGTHYVSFLASVGGDMRVRLYDIQGNSYDQIHYETIRANTDRVDGEPSNFTQFWIYLPGVDIARMDLDGGFNACMIDDLIIGGALGYLPDPDPEPTPDPTPEPTPPDTSVDYSSAAERMKLLVGAVYNNITFGYNPVMGTFYTADEIINGEPLNWDPFNKELSFTPGICDVGAIIWAVNGENNENVINNAYIDNMANKDFTWWVAYGDQRPGDVAFIDYEADGYYDEVVMFIEPQIDPETGVPEDCIRILEEDGVHYTDSEFLHAIYGIDNGVGVQSFMDVKRLPESPKGGKSPYKKMPGKYKKSI